MVIETFCVTKPDYISGKWVGVVLDDDSGKNNGEVQGKKYFSCPDNHGIFVRPNQVGICRIIEMKFMHF